MRPGNIRFFLVCALLFGTVSALFSVPVCAADAPEIQHASGAYVYNFENDRVLYEYHTEDRIYPASTVKLMTGILALEHWGENLSATITVTDTMLDKVTGNNIALRAGEIVTVSDMLHALLVNGANDAAQVLAVAVAGSLDAFVEQMNDKAQRIGAYDTYYTNPTGMHSDAMVTTVSDTAAIARYAYSLPGFVEITSVSQYVMEATNLSDYRNLFNRNAQLSKFYDIRYLYSGSLGLNSGYTVQAGYCLVSIAQRDELTYLCVVMNAEEDDEQIYSYYNAELLLDWAFASYQYMEVLSTNARICEIPVELSSAVDYVTLVPADSIVRYLPTDTDPDQLHVSYTTFEETLSAPVEAGQVCGTVTVTLGEEILGSVELVSTTSVTRSEFLYWLSRIRQFTNSRFFRATVVFAVVFGIAYVLIEARRREQRLRRYYK